MENEKFNNESPDRRGEFADIPQQIQTEPPAETAIKEEDDKPAAKTIWIAVIIAIIIMAIIYFFVFYNRDVVSSAS